MQIRNVCVAFIFMCAFTLNSHAEEYYEISGSPFATNGAPLPAKIKSRGEKLIIVDPNEHAWGAYSVAGKLIRWGIATTGSPQCRDSNQSCRTKVGTFRIYSLGDVGCYSTKFPVPEGGASMPYCMYFSGGQAIHGSDDVAYENASHGCVRVHIDDAKWLRYKFIEAPNPSNQHHGTQVIIKPYTLNSAQNCYKTLLQLIIKA